MIQTGDSTDGPTGPGHARTPQKSAQELPKELDKEPQVVHHALPLIAMEMRDPWK